MTAAMISPRLAWRVNRARVEFRKMLEDRRVMMTLIVCGTVFACVVVLTVGYLAATGHDTVAIGAIIGGPLLTILGVIAGRLKALNTTVAARSTDG